MTKTPIERFNDKWTVDEDGCHIWHRASLRSGYGRIGLNGKYYLAHRWMFWWYHGFWPEVVMHWCDKPACVNIGCLMPGTQLDNVRDMLKKERVSHSRRSVGDSHGRSKLTWEEVATIREAYKTGIFTQKMLGDVFGVYNGTISRIVGDRYWLETPEGDK